jgi:hypothetical protein
MNISVMVERHGTSWSKVMVEPALDPPGGQSPPGDCLYVTNHFQN